MTTCRSLWCAAIFAALAATLEADPPPGNLFAEPVNITGSHWEGDLQNALANREPGEKQHLANVPQIKSIWLRWTAPTAGVVYVTASLSKDFWPIFTVPGQQPWGVAVYDDTNSIAALTLLAAPQGDLGYAVTTVFQAQAGASYRIAFDSGVPRDEAGQPNIFHLLLEQPATNIPANDSLAAAQVIEAGTPVFCDLRGATLETGEPPFGEWSWPFYTLVANPFGGLHAEHWLLPKVRGGNSVWYRWIAPADGAAAVKLFLPSSVPQLAVYRLDPPTGDGALAWNHLQELARMTPGGSVPEGDFYRFAGESATHVALSIKAGEEYVFQADQISPGTNWRLTDDWVLPDYDSFGWITVLVVPQNDQFAGARELETDTPQNFDLTGATIEPNEPATPFPSDAGTFWWKWTAPEDTVLGFAGTVSGIFTGPSVGQLTRIPPTSPATSLPYFQTFRGETYYFQTAAASDRGSITLISRFPNDRFANAEPLFPAGESQRLIGDRVATLEPGEPQSAGIAPGTGVIWYDWVPSQSGRFAFRYDGGQLQFFRGDSLESLQAAPVLLQPQRETPYLIDAQAGERIRVAVAVTSRGGTVELATPAANDAFALATLLPVREPVFAPPWAGTSEAGEPPSGDKPVGASLWYRVDRPPASPCTLNVQGPAGTRVVVYRGESLSQLTLLAQVSLPFVTPPALSRAALNLAALGGESFRVAVEPGPLDPGSLKLQMDLGHPYDTPEGAPLSSSTSFVGDTLGATPELASQDPYGDPGFATVWYRWLAPAAGDYAVRCSNTADWWHPDSCSVTVLERNSRGQFTAVAHGLPRRGWPSSLARFTSSAATTYYFRVETDIDAPGSFVVNVLSNFDSGTPESILLEPQSAFDLLKLSGQLGSVVNVEWSPDLVRWALLGSAELGGASTEVRLRSDLPPTRFMRAVFR